MYWLVSGLFVWKYSALDNKPALLDGYPKRASDIFPGIVGSINAIFSVSDTVFILHNNDKLSTYTISDTSIFRKSKTNQNRQEYLTAGGVSVTRGIKSAFSHGSSTIMVAQDNGFYKVTTRLDHPF